MHSLKHKRCCTIMASGEWMTRKTLQNTVQPYGIIDKTLKYQRVKLQSTNQHYVNGFAANKEVAQARQEGKLPARKGKLELSYKIYSKNR